MVRVWGPNAGGVADPWAVARGGSHQGGPPPAQPSRAHTHLPAAKEQRPEKAPPASRPPPRQLKPAGSYASPAPCALVALGNGSNISVAGLLQELELECNKSGCYHWVQLGPCSERGFVDQFKRLTFYSNPFSVKLSRELLKALQPREDQAFLLQRKPENHTGHQDDEITQDVQEEAYGSKSTPVNGPCSLYLDKGPPPAPDSFCSIPS